jgi:AcrR family transcriptional regulator
MAYAVKAMPRPKSLTHERIAAAALAVIDRAGLDTLSMRTVALELGTGTMSLYRYVEDREQLEQLVVDLVLRDLDPVPPAGPWVGRVTVLFERIREAVGAHPAVVPLFLSHRHRNPRVMACGEALLGILTDAGFRDRQRVIAFRTLIGYLVGALSAERFGPLSGPGTVVLAELPPTPFPLLAETARTAREIPVAEEFGGGLAIVLAGLGALTTP